VRLFVAVDVPASIKDAIDADVVEPLQALEGAKWTRPQGRHLTLAFLGNVDDERVDDVAAALRGVHHDPFEAAFDAVGGFPNVKRPRVLWVGIGNGRERLASLAASVQVALEPLGFEPERRAFHPHFTLSRFPQPRAQSVPEVEVPQTPFAVDAFCLFRSQLHPKGARYTVLERFTLSE
jgi:RNA 2',3'-cyclic 3'-phosphodiesterase